MVELRQAREQGSDLREATLPALPARFDSRSERVIAGRMEKYLPGWRCIPGDTFQVPLDDKRIDFRIQGRIWFEYHPITKWEWDDKSAYHRFEESLRGLPTWRKAGVWNAVKDELACKYCRRRRALLKSNRHQDEPLIVCHNAREVYRYIILPFGKNVPAEQEFLKEWSGEMNRVSDSSPTYTRDG